MCAPTKAAESQDILKLALSCMSLILYKLQKEEGEAANFFVSHLDYAQLACVRVLSSPW